MRRARWPGPRRIAHRGGGTLAPENTLAAIREGLARGYRGVEFDVMLTADGVPVLMHDPKFGRTIAGRGTVASTTYADLAGRDAGSWFDARFAGEPVPRYDDVARFCIEHGIWMNVEIKPSPGRELETGRVVGERSARLLESVPDASATMLFSSFSVAALTAARAAAPEIPRGILFDGIPRSGLDAARALDCISVHANHRKLVAVDVERLHDAAMSVMAYTVNDGDRIATLDAWGVDALCTDRIDLVPPGPPGAIFRPVQPDS